MQANGLSASADTLLPAYPENPPAVSQHGHPAQVVRGPNTPPRTPVQVGQLHYSQPPPQQHHAFQAPPGTQQQVHLPPPLAQPVTPPSHQHATTPNPHSPTLLPPPQLSASKQLTSPQPQPPAQQQPFALGPGLGGGQQQQPGGDRRPSRFTVTSVGAAVRDPVPGSDAADSLPPIAEKSPSEPREPLPASTSTASIQSLLRAVLRTQQDQSKQIAALTAAIAAQQHMMARLLTAQGIADEMVEPGEDLMETVVMLDIQCEALREENAKLAGEVRKLRTSSVTAGKNEPAA